MKLFDVTIKGKGTTKPPPLTQEQLAEYRRRFDTLPKGDVRNAAYHLLAYVQQAERTLDPT